jgi:outer membrane protein OmpA-like peptidoglycan-associated protein
MRRAWSWIGIGVLGGVLAVNSAVAEETTTNGGGPIGGLEVGAVLPHNSFDRFSTTGFVAAPYLGYMFNDYLGLMVQGQGLVAPNRSLGIDAEETSAALAGGVGPRAQYKLGPMNLYGTFQVGGLTGLTAPSSITDTSWGWSTGGGVYLDVTPNISVGGWARYNRWYQRVHHGIGGPGDTRRDGTPYPVSCPDCGDLRYTSVGIGVDIHRAPVAAPPPPPVVAQAPPPPPPPPPAPAKKRIVLRGVNFDFDKSNIRADARPVLDEAIATLKASGGVAVIAEGHTDSKGTDAYNKRLSERRARAVKDYLVKGGISASRIETVGYGESKPVASNDTEDGRAQNRRVELRIRGE